MILFVFEYRPLENDFLLVEASLLVPCSYVSRIVPYKYIVFKEKRKDSKEEKYLWDHLVSWGVFKNRCLQIPKDRCVPEGVYLFIYVLFIFCNYINQLCLLFWLCLTYLSQMIYFKSFIAIDSHCQPIQDNIISVETFTCVALFVFPFFFPVGNSWNQTHTTLFWSNNK